MIPLFPKGPYLECDEEGAIKVTPYVQQCIDGGADATVEIGLANSKKAKKRARSGALPPNSKKRKKGGKRGKLVRSGRLADEERSRLHVEIYKYFSWLRGELAALPTTPRGRERLRRAGVAVSGIEDAMAALEGAFCDVGTFRAREDERGRDGEGGAGDVDDEEEEEDAAPYLLPLLEECVEEELRRVAEEEEQLRLDAEEEEQLRLVAGEEKQTEEEDEEEDEGEDDVVSNERDFDDLFERLADYKEENGDCDVPRDHEDEDGAPLGEWVARLRREEEKLLARGLTCEPPDGAVSVSIPISPGRLGLCLQFYKSGGGAVVTSINP